MSSPLSSPSPGRLDLSRWRNVPNVLVLVGGVGVLAGLGYDLMRYGNARHFGYAWLGSFMFYLSFGLGGLFLVLVHHLFDASWSVPIRRFCEHLTGLLFPALAVAFVPILLLATTIYPWMKANPLTDHALEAKWPLFTQGTFYLAAAVCFGLWWWVGGGLRYWSLKQDETGAALCTYRMRRYAAVGIWVFALTLTLAAIMWMKGLMHQWFSTMYGVYYFAESVWVTLAVVYVISLLLKRTGMLEAVLGEKQFYFLGSLLLAFTVFYAYIHFAQYFIIWNANMPEETYWYVVREKGAWWSVGMVIIFGHFFVPFLALLRIDVKQFGWWMVPVCFWALLMHYFDVSFNVMPNLYPAGLSLKAMCLDAACLALLGGLLTKVFLRLLNAHPLIPIKDPRLLEALDRYVPAAGEAPAAPSHLAAARAETHGGAK